MYRHFSTTRQAANSIEEPPTTDPDEAARFAIDRVRKALTAYKPGMPFEAGRLQSLLEPQCDSVTDRVERLFCLGWLNWLTGNWLAAEPILAEAAKQTEKEVPPATIAERSYWYARIGLLLQRADALPCYEATLKALNGSPRATAWYVDLLWRAGRVERAERVWKAVRGNRQVATCDEGPLLESRSLLRRGEIAQAKRRLTEAAPASAVVQAERWLFLAWIAKTQGQQPDADQLFEHAEGALYPASALAAWRGALAGQEMAAPAALADYLQGQELRLKGETAAATRAFRAALETPAGPFVRYALAILGHDDFSALLAAQPGLFLAFRCRAQLAVERFRRREATPAEFLEALQLAGTVGYASAAANHFRGIAAVLRQRTPTREAIAALAQTNADSLACRQNFLRAAVEAAALRLSPAEARECLAAWERDPEVSGDKALAELMASQQLRLRLLDRSSAQAEALASIDGSPATDLWQAAQSLDRGPVDDEWRTAVRALKGQPRWQPLAWALLVQEAASRADAASVAALLDDGEVWRGFGSQAPSFVAAAVASVVAARPDHPVWQAALPRWMSLWQTTTAPELAIPAPTRAWAFPFRGSSTAPPVGVPATRWYLFQAAAAIGRDDAAESLACVRAAQRYDPELATIDDKEAIHAALPELVRQAQAQALLGMVWGDCQQRPRPGMLVDLVDLLNQSEVGARLLTAAEGGDSAATEAVLAELLDSPQLSSRIAHHLALLYQRLAFAQPENGRTVLAGLTLAWNWWLRFLAAETAFEGRADLLDWLLAFHRDRIVQALARADVDAARLDWQFVVALPNRAARMTGPCGAEMQSRIARLRDELATEYIVLTRETMHSAEAPNGFRADYALGLTALQRILSLDRDNPRLLTAMLEICGDYGFDLYNARDNDGLIAQVTRYTPFALQLARLVEATPGDLPARAALAEFTKLRGFVAADPVQKAELYRAALRFNPANENVRSLLAELEGA